MQKISDIRCFGGHQQRYQHHSGSLNCEMNFSVYLPPLAEQKPVPAIFWLSGLTCSDENFVQKAGAQRYASEHGVAMIAADTSPRGEAIPDDPDDEWDFGIGAGFYVNATQEPWRKNYQMYDYICEELPELIFKQLPLDASRQSMMGHSMGGHGAITMALKNPGRYKAVSAFAPICSPMNCPWGEKALSHYLGNDRQQWAQYDSCALIKSAKERLPILIDQGDQDGFLDEQLKPERLADACREANHPFELRIQSGYDHSYFFIASFIGEHIAHHSQAFGERN